MTELSPAARAIVQPFNDDWDEYCLAAALDALADVVVPPESLRLDNCCDHRSMGHRHQILAIAAELRGEATTTPAGEEGI